MARWKITGYGGEVSYKNPLKITDDATDQVLHEGGVRIISATHEPSGHEHEGWVWECTCGGRGRPQFQSPEASAFQWWEHVHRKEGIPIPREPRSPNHLGWAWYAKEEAK